MFRTSLMIIAYMMLFAVACRLFWVMGLRAGTEDEGKRWRTWLGLGNRDTIPCHALEAFRDAVRPVTPTLRPHHPDPAQCWCSNPHAAVTPYVPTGTTDRSAYGVEVAHEAARARDDAIYGRHG